ncbi:MAG: hypothetical protein HKN09_10195 [Saprospiraceae bacterium]|nr:hypothetical protein [Saprospiraceae bacterium]
MKKLLLGLGVFLFFLLGIILRPVPSPTAENTFTLTDKVVRVFEGPCNDIVFQLNSGDKYAYINRGLELGLDIEVLNQQLKGKETHFKLIKHWTPLDWNNSSESIAAIETDQGEVLYHVIN